MTCATDPVPIPSGLGDRVEVVLRYGEQSPRPGTGTRSHGSQHRARGAPRSTSRGAVATRPATSLPSGPLDRDSAGAGAVTHGVGATLPGDPDVVLAEIGPQGVDVTVRSVVLSNAVLFELLLRLDDPQHRSGLHRLGGRT